MRGRDREDGRGIRGRNDRPALRLAKQHGARRKLRPRGQRHRGAAAEGVDEGHAGVAQPVAAASARSDAERARAARPDLALSSDFIVGFPGETEDDFQQTLQLVERIRYDNLYAYTYSPRPGTHALRFGDTVPEDVKKDRHSRLLALQGRIQNEKNREQIGIVEEILCEGPSRSEPSVATGRTLGMRVVNFAPPAGVSPEKLEGRFVPVKITDATSFALKGELALV